MSALPSQKCGCPKYEPHLWRIGLCKVCFHTNAEHQGSGQCTHVGEPAAHPKPVFLEQWTSRAKPERPVARTPPRPGAASRVATVALNPKQREQRELETLRDTAAAVASLVGAEDETAAAPRALADVFETTAASLVAAAGVQDEPFVRDFLAAFKIAVSTQPLLAGAGPLAPPQLAHLRAAGKSIWYCYKLQDHLQTVTHAQGLMLSCLAKRRAAASPARKPPMLQWLDKAKALLASERMFCMTLESDTSDLPSISVAHRLHRTLVCKFEEVCAAYPQTQSWSIGATVLQWLGDAIPVYSMLLRELSLAKKESKEARAAFLSAICPRLGLYEAMLRQFAEQYQAMLKHESTVLTASDRATAEADALTLSRAGDVAAAAAVEAAKRSEELALPVAAHALKLDDDGPTRSRSATTKRRRASSKRKTVSDVVSAFSESILLPENTNRIVQLSGSMTATIRTESNPAARPADYRHNLLSDFWIIYSDVPKSHTLVVVINLKEASIASYGTDGFEVSTQGTTVTVTHAKPKRIEALLHEDIARLRVFGVPLEDLLLVDNEQGGIPRVALLCMEFVEKHGFASEGIFRVAGKPSVMSALQTAFNNRSAEVDFSAVSAHDVAHLFKRFLNELPEPLLTGEGYKKFMALSQQIPPPPGDEGELQRFVEAARNIVRALPPAHKELARVIFAFLSVCADCSPKTKMTVANLAIVLAPVILRPRSPPINVFSNGVVPLMDLASVTKANAIVQLMIENHFDVFC